MAATTIAGRYLSDTATREPFLDIARVCARLTDPTILPRTTETPRHPVSGEPLPQNFQSTGARGVLGLASLTLLALYPPDVPFFEIVPPAEIINNPQVTSEQKRAIMGALRIYEIIIMSALES